MILLYFSVEYYMLIVDLYKEKNFIYIKIQLNSTDLIKIKNNFLVFHNEYRINS